MRKECKTLHVKAVDLLVLAVDHFNRALQEDADFFKTIRIGKSTHKRYRLGRLVGETPCEPNGFGG